MRCEKFNPKLVDFSKTASENVWLQFGKDIYKSRRKINVTKHYMPYEEQDKLRDYMLANYKKLKAYKIKRKEWIRRQMSWETLAYFPTGIKKGTRK